ncbi:hypothetical protein LG651_14170 [Tamlana sp. 62-3]|uniref:Uncharacterized protein n=1 Tax=Neotamlana sargassicola TaxID=2883125 RepID=A0A9X1I8P5_9FLAO|nr:hypothetical protein [Tamlana sargassicola]MCB4809398.1 hypothetical protein [Tamlana sargassicola]
MNYNKFLSVKLTRLIISLCILISLNSCDKKDKKTYNDEINYSDFNYYKIINTKNRESSTDQLIELEIYGTTKENMFVNQVKSFLKTDVDIDSLNSHFYTLKFNEYKPLNYKGYIDIVYGKEKVIDIEFKVITSTNNEKEEILSFKSIDSNRVNFNFINVDSKNPIKGVLCIKIESELIVEEGEEKIVGYYFEYMFVDTKKFTNNSFIEEYKNKK